MRPKLNITLLFQRAFEVTSHFPLKLSEWFEITDTEITPPKKRWLKLFCCSPFLIMPNC